MKRNIIPVFICIVFSCLITRTCTMNEAADKYRAENFIYEDQAKLDLINILDHKDVQAKFEHLKLDYILRYWDTTATRYKILCDSAYKAGLRTDTAFTIYNRNRLTRGY